MTIICRKNFDNIFLRMPPLQNTFDRCFNGWLRFTQLTNLDLKYCKLTKLMLTLLVTISIWIFRYVLNRPVEVYCGPS